MTDEEYVRAEDLDKYFAWSLSLGKTFARAPVAELWHYTTADALIKILETGKIWSTQSQCLNDSLEQKYLGSYFMPG
jgi:hypothetical protein